MTTLDAAAIVRGTVAEPDQVHRCEVLVVGSGSGGAVVARELAEEGHDVIVLEEGPFVSHKQYGKWRPMQSFRRLARAGGSTVAAGLGKTPTIQILAGSAVGGSSILTGGVCFRIPDAVHAEWVDLLGTDSLSERAMSPLYARVEEMVHVEEVPLDMRSEVTRRFGAGAAKLGVEMKAVRRNTKGCCGCSRCNFGCPHGAKLSVDLTYLPRAVERGARIFADHRVEKVLVEDGRAVGVRGQLVSDPDRTPRGRFEIRADVVVLACGTMHTPHLLKKSGIGKRSRQVGRNLTLHPSFRAVGVFDDPVYGWRGALQSAYIDAFEDRKLMFVSVNAPPNVLAGTFPGIGRTFVDRLKRATCVGAFGFMVHDEPGGRVRRGLGREPLVLYRMAKEDRIATVEGLRFMAEAYFAGGAREVLLPVFGAPPFTSMDQVRAHITPKMDFRRLESLSFHPLGTCRMGTDDRSSVCDHLGRVWNVDNLWLADGSVVPTSVGVNTQIPIMTMATRIGFAIAEARRAA